MKSPQGYKPNLEPEDLLTDLLEATRAMHASINNMAKAISALNLPQPRIDINLDKQTEAITKALKKLSPVQPTHGWEFNIDRDDEGIQKVTAHRVVH